jgi:transcriptional regulator with XRE-family HTH domain
MKHHIEFSEFNPKEFGHNMGRLRVWRGYTQPVFADILGINTRTLQSFESGVGKISLEMAFKIAKELQVPLTQLLNLNENSIVNSFNTLQKDATSMVHSNFHAEIDKEHSKRLIDRIEFLENLVLSMRTEIVEHLKKNEIK